MSKVLELFGYSSEAEVDWANVAQAQPCPYLERSCVKTRKSQPETAIGTCSVAYGGQNVIICPHRLLERRQVFLDCLHLLTRHEPGNELHVIAEVSIPGGSVDYVLPRLGTKRLLILLELNCKHWIRLEVFGVNGKISCGNAACL